MYEDCKLKPNYSQVCCLKILNLWGGQIAVDKVWASNLQTNLSRPMNPPFIGRRRIQVPEQRHYIPMFFPKDKNDVYFINNPLD